MNWEIINTIVSIIQIIVSVVLIVSVLMQSAKKEGISGVVGGASETFFGKNKGKTLDAKFALITTICAVIFLVSSLFLSYGHMSVEKMNEKPETEISTNETVDITNEETQTPTDPAEGAAE